MSLFWCVIFNLAWAIEHSTEIADSSENPFDAPTYVGPKGKQRKMSAGQKFKMATLAAENRVFHSGAAVAEGMELLGKKFMECARTGNKWSEPLAFQYLHTLQETFRFMLDRVPIFSLAWDATRLSHMDVLATTIYSPLLNLAGWCPPQAVFC